MSRIAKRYLPRSQTSNSAVISSVSLFFFIIDYWAFRWNIKCCVFKKICIYNFSLNCNLFESIQRRSTVLSAEPMVLTRVLQIRPQGEQMDTSGLDEYEETGSRRGCSGRLLVRRRRVWWDVTLEYRCTAPFFIGVQKSLGGFYHVMLSCKRKRALGLGKKCAAFLLLHLSNRMRRLSPKLLPQTHMRPVMLC